MTGEVDCAPEHVQHTPVDVSATQQTELLVELLRVRVAEVIHPLDIEIEENLRDAGADAGNAP